MAKLIDKRTDKTVSSKELQINWIENERKQEILDDYRWDSGLSKIACMSAEETLSDKTLVLELGNGYELQIDTYDELKLLGFKFKKSKQEVK